LIHAMSFAAMWGASGRLVCCSLALAWCAVASHGHADDVDEPLPGLKRVIVLSRHGNRAPNPQIEVVCPVFAREVLPMFGVAPAALSRVGMAENWENGQFLRHRYRHFLPHGPYSYDGTFAFFSERAERNIVSTAALARGMFPDGSGLEGFAKERPNIVPIATTQDGADVLMNCPRDGPCQRALSRDKKAWISENEERIYAQHSQLFRTVSAACGFALEPGKITYKGKSKPLTWAAKAVMDAFSFAQNEGLDPTMGGRLSLATIEEFHAVVEGMVNGMNFGKPHQITYWAGDFIPTMLGLTRVPLQQPANKLHVFLNHRELIYVVAHILGVPIEFPGVAKDSLPSGCSLIVEVYDEGLRLFFWSPSQPSWKHKAKYLKKQKPMLELFRHGRLQPAIPAGCGLGKLCPVEALALSFIEFVRITGTYVKICNVSVEETYFAKGEASLGIMEHWVEPTMFLKRGVNTTPRSAAAIGLTRDDATSLGISFAEKGAHTTIGASNDTPVLFALAAVAFSLLTGCIGFWFGKHAGQGQGPSVTTAPYVQLS